MKLSLATAGVILGLSAVSALSAGCTSSTDAPPPPAQPVETPSPNRPEPPARRKMVDGSLLPTPTSNLIIDPGFAVAGSETGSGSFFAFYDDGSFTRLDVNTALDSRSPAHFAGAVATLKPNGATDTKSDPVRMLGFFLGGAGPFDAQVWVSRTTVSGKPAAVPTDTKSVRVSLADGNPDGQAFDLAADDAATRRDGDRTWLLFKGTVDGPITKGGFFLISVGSSGGYHQFAAPQVVPRALASTSPLAFTRGLAARTKTASESAAIRFYASRRPRLVPAGQDSTLRGL